MRAKKMELAEPSAEIPEQSPYSQKVQIDETVYTIDALLNERKEEKAEEGSKNLCGKMKLRNPDWLFYAQKGNIYAVLQSIQCGI